MSLTPQQAATRLSLAQKKFGQRAEKIAREFATRVGVRATSFPHMRQTTAGAGRRKKGDTGPLRRVSNRLARSLLPGAGTFRPEAIERATLTGFKLRFEKGSLVPYAAVHEYGYAPKNIPARPYMGPASKIEKTFLARRAGKEMKDMILTTLRTGE